MNRCTETIALVRSTGKTLLARLSGAQLNVRRKENNHQNLVTDFDLWVQDVLREGLQQICPDARFFAEEKNNDAVEGLTWIVDPIDGTTNFICTQRDFAICVALYDGTTPIFGVVYDVAADICYHAVRGEGAWRDGVALARRTPVALEDALIDASMTTVNNLSRRAGQSLHQLSCAIRGHRALGSASLAMCHIAEGRLDGYVSARLYPWDYAASGVVLCECGGGFTAVFDDALFATERAAVFCYGDDGLKTALLPFLQGKTKIDALLPAGYTR